MRVCNHLWKSSTVTAVDVSVDNMVYRRERNKPVLREKASPFGMKSHPAANKFCANAPHFGNEKQQWLIQPTSMAGWPSDSCDCCCNRMSVDLRSAILAACAPDSNQQAAANSWLTQFLETDAVWEETLKLMGDADEQVRFFAANILLTKTRTQWHCLSLDIQHSLITAVSKHIQPGIQSGSSPAVSARICLLMAAMSIVSSHEITATFIATALQYAGIGQNGAQICLWMLKSLPEELDRLDITQQRAVGEIMQANVSGFLIVIQSTMASFQSGNDPMLLLGLECLLAWVKMGHSLAKSGHAILLPYSVGKPGEQQGVLLDNLLKLLGSQNEYIGKTASEIIAEILTTYVYEGAPEQNIVSPCISGLITYLGRVSEVNGSDCAQNVARVASSLADNYPETLIHSSEQAVMLSEVMLKCIERMDTYVAELVLDFFLVLSEIPVSKRPAPLQEPVFEHLLHHILSLACYPKNFINWRDSLMEEDTFVKFRDENLAEGIDMCFRRLWPSRFHQCLMRVLQNPQSWQSVEASIFCLRAVASLLVPKIMSEATRGQSMGQELVGGVIQSLSANEGPIGHYMTNPHLIQTMCRFLMDFSSLLKMKQFEGYLTLVIKFIVRQGLAEREARKWAPKAFCRICGVCKAQLANADTIRGLVSEIASLPTASPGRPHGLGISERIPLWEGIVRLAAQLELEAASTLGCQIGEPVLLTISSEARKGVPGSGVSSSVAESLSAELELLSSMVRFLEGDGAPGTKLVQGSWDIVHGVLQAGSWVSSEAVIASASGFFMRSFFACRATILDLIPNLINTIVAIFDRYRYPCCLEVLSKAAQVYGRLNHAPIDGVMTNAAQCVCQTLSGLFQDNRLVGHSEVITQFFTYMDQCLLFVPKYLLSLSAFPLLMEWSTKAISLQERDPVESALAFLTHILTPGKKIREMEERKLMMPVINNSIANGGQVLIQQLVWAACTTCPRHLLMAVAASLRGLMEHEGFGAHVLQWMHSTVQQPKFHSAFGNRLTRENNSLFCELICRVPKLPAQRLEAMLVDFMSIVRGEGAIDALISYQM